MNYPLGWTGDAPTYKVGEVGDVVTLPLPRAQCVTCDPEKTREPSCSQQSIGAIMATMFTGIIWVQPIHHLSIVKTVFVEEAN